MSSGSHNGFQDFNGKRVRFPSIKCVKFLKYSEKSLISASFEKLQGFDVLMQCESWYMRHIRVLCCLEQHEHAHQNIQTPIHKRRHCLFLLSVTLRSEGVNDWKKRVINVFEVVCCCYSKLLELCTAAALFTVQCPRKVLRTLRNSATSNDCQFPLPSSPAPFSPSQWSQDDNILWKACWEFGAWQGNATYHNT